MRFNHLLGLQLSNNHTAASSSHELTNFGANTNMFSSGLGITSIQNPGLTPQNNQQSNLFASLGKNTIQPIQNAAQHFMEGSPG